jgi:hypothetical protein
LAIYERQIKMGNEILQIGLLDAISWQAKRISTVPIDQGLAEDAGSARSRS